MILGSSSPRRKEVMNFFSLPFRQISSDFDEDSVAFTGDPHSYAKTLAEKKGEQLCKDYSDEIILTADTVVYFNNNVFNKPKDSLEAFKFLKDFSGKWNQVFTGVAIRKGNSLYSSVEKSKILFNELTDDEIKKYLQFGGHLDKAGGYTIQHAGSLLVKKMEGCYYNVMGMPINTIRALLLNVGIDLWDYLKPF